MTDTIDRYLVYKSKGLYLDPEGKWHKFTNSIDMQAWTWTREQALAIVQVLRSTSVTTDYGILFLS